MRSVIVSLVSLSLASSLTLACTSRVQGTGAPADGTDGDGTADGGSKKSLGSSLGGSKTDKDPSTPSKPAQQPTAKKTCATAAICASECADGDDACVEDCLANLPDAEVAKLQDVAVCLEESACETDQCIEESCGAEIQACIGE